MKLSLLCFTLMLTLISNAHAGALDKKGKWYFYYGYNRAEYSNGDYHITGNGNDFVLKNVKATDHQTPIGADPYLNPFAWSVPQNTMRFGYYFTDTLSLSLGNDHMKYHMVPNQTVGIEGTIVTAGAPHDGVYASGATKQLTTDFLTLEHSDGLNYVSLELEHYVPLWASKKEDFALSFFWGPGFAIMYPKTNAKLFSNARNDQFHIAGTGYSIKAGLEYIFFDDWFTRLVTKFGEIDMNDVLLTKGGSERLAHKFSFAEVYLVLGINF